MAQNETIPGTVLGKVGDFRTPDFVTRYEGNPIRSHRDVPFGSTNTHNCGVIQYGDGFLMLFRNDCRKSWGNPRHDGFPQ